MENEDLSFILKNHEIQVMLNKESLFKGDLFFSGVARIEGIFEGKIKGDGVLIIDKGAQVKADVELDSLILLGSLEGKVLARKNVIMEPPGEFKGDISSPNLSIKEGVFFEGSSKRTKSE